MSIYKGTTQVAGIPTGLIDTVNNKVDKSGGTITGTLTSTQLGTGDSAVPFIVTQKYATSYGQMSYCNIMFKDSNNGNVAIIGSVQDTNGSNGVRFLTWDSTNNTWVNHSYIKTCYTSGTSGYRIWTNGFCEQWGVVSSGSNSVTFLKTFKDTTYLPMVSGYDNNYAITYYTINHTTSSMTVSAKNISGTEYTSCKKAWKASGYLAEGEY